MGKFQVPNILIITVNTIIKGSFRAREVVQDQIPIMFNKPYLWMKTPLIIALQLMVLSEDQTEFDINNSTFIPQSIEYNRVGTCAVGVSDIHKPRWRSHSPSPHLANTHIGLLKTQI